MRRAECVFWIFGTLIVSSVLHADQPVFRRHVINADSTNCACAVLDVNCDGKLDIVAGNLWYQAPNWDKHPVREVEQIRGRPDDYSNLPLDVNKDGHIDLVSCNYRSQSLYWIQNPGPAAATDATWIKHEIAKPGPMETGRLADIDGDGNPDVLPNGTQFAAWWNLEPGSEPKWSQFPLPEELAGHGLGFGDINGDGRNDVIGPKGWAEAPEDRRNGRWTFHSEFNLWKGASIPILVEDVDTDGDNDLIWGRGHRFGLYWMEQAKDSEGNRRWIRHAIDTSWSQAHSLLWADLDGDQRSELIAGSRYLGHDGKDPGEYNPLVVCSYQYLPETRTWKRTVISSGDNVGFGLDPKVADLDGDQDLDLICPDRSGLHVLENLLRNPAGSPPDSAKPAITADNYNHADVSTVKDRDGNSRLINTPFEMGLRRTHILDGMSLAMGPLPASEQRVPLEMDVLMEESTDKYLRRRISFASEPGDRVPAWLLIPKDLESPAAAMLCLHQTTGIGKGEPAGLGGLENLHYAHELAELGFVCLVPDYPSFGDYPYDFKVKGAHYDSGSMKAIWNNIRAIDLLESLEEVDPDRIGCIGHSLGGHNTLFTAAFDCRIQASVTSCGFTAFHHYYEGNLAGWTSDRYMPRIRDEYGNDPSRVPFDFYEVLAAIAPRSIFVNAPISDNNFENSGVRKVVKEVEKAQKIYGEQAGVITARYPECEHDFPDEVRAEAYQWLKEQLQ
jgi:dienelactone hydrolase